VAWRERPIDPDPRADWGLQAEQEALIPQLRACTAKARTRHPSTPRARLPQEVERGFAQRMAAANSMAHTRSRLTLTTLVCAGQLRVRQVHGRSSRRLELPERAAGRRFGLFPLGSRVYVLHNEGRIAKEDWVGDLYVVAVHHDDRL
jgi:hypothetical protein